MGGCNSGLSGVCFLIELPVIQLGMLLSWKWELEIFNSETKEKGDITMKKIKKTFLMLVCAIMTCVLFGCGSNSAPPVNSSLDTREDQSLTSESTEETEVEMVTGGDDTASEDETVIEEDTAISDAGSFEVGDTVNIEKILDYISSGTEYAVVYAVKRGEEYQIAYYADDDGEGKTKASLYGENGNWGLVPETTILQVSASQNDELVYFGNGSLFLRGVSSYSYAAPFPVAARTEYGEEIPGEFTSYKTGYRTVGHYMKNKIEGPDNWDTFYSWIITEINGIPAEDVSIQDKLIAIEGYNHVYVLLNDEETIVFGGYENTTWGEAKFKCGYMFWSLPDEEFKLEGTRTKEGYTIVANGSELKALGDYTIFMYNLCGLVEVVD